MRKNFRENYSKAIRRAAHDRLASLPRGHYKKPRVLHEWIDGAGRSSSIFDLPHSSSSSLRFVSLLMLGEHLVHRVRAYYAQRRSLGNLCSSPFCKRAYLFSSRVIRWFWIQNGIGFLIALILGSYA